MKTEHGNMKANHLTPTPEGQLGRRRKATGNGLINKAWVANPRLCQHYGTEMCIAVLIDESEIIERILRHLACGTTSTTWPEVPGTGSHGSIQTRAAR